MVNALPPPTKPTAPFALKPRTREHPWFLWVAFITVVTIILAQNAVILTRAPASTAHVVSDLAFFSACVNLPPAINISACSPFSFVSSGYSCVINGSDTAQTNLSFSVTQFAGPPAGMSLFVLNGSSLNFTPALNQIGNYTLKFAVDDQSGCGNGVTNAYLNLSIENTQFAPFLATPIPNETWPAGSALIPFDLDNYFVDPNNDPLAYLVSGNIHIGISITTGQVTLTPETNWCGIETVFFTATDPTNLSASSNPVILNVTCPSSSNSAAATTTGSSGSSGSSASSSGGGRSGSGSGSSFIAACGSSYTCYDWSACQFTRKVSLVNGSIQKIEIEGVRGADIYTIASGASSDPGAYYEGFQYQTCIDVNQCAESFYVQTRPCSYVPNCFDGIANQDETAVDCGGSVCKPCSTCADGVQNGLEEGLDCGGPLCTACNTCFDGKMNGLESGLDCGGPDCAACSTCSDGVKNSLETGVDCGGPFCLPCAETAYPAGTLPWVTITLVVGVLLALAFLIAVSLKHRLASLLMKLLYLHKRRNRIILIPSDLKAEIIRRLAALEARVQSQPMLKSQEELAGISRDYYSAALGLHFEFTNEELIEALNKHTLNALLASILQRFFERINVLEFSGLSVTPIVLKTLIQETRELVYQTSVLTVDDLAERERDLMIRDIPEGTPSLDKGYLLVSQVHLALEFGKIDVASALYDVLQRWYERASLPDQQAIYEDISRVYDELRLALGETSASRKPTHGSGGGLSGTGLTSSTFRSTTSSQSLQHESPRVIPVAVAVRAQPAPVAADVHTTSRPLIVSPVSTSQVAVSVSVSSAEVLAANVIIHRMSESITAIRVRMPRIRSIIHPLDRRVIEDAVLRAERALEFSRTLVPLPPQDPAGALVRLQSVLAIIVEAEATIRQFLP